MADSINTLSARNLDDGNPNKIIQFSSDPGFKELVEDSPLAIYKCDKDGCITFFNQAAVVLLGHEPEIGKDLWFGSLNVYNPDGSLMPQLAYPMTRTLKEGKSFENAEIIIERPDHTFRNLLVFSKPIFAGNNTIIGAHNTLIDITDQKLGGEKQAMLSAIVESSVDGIISKSLDGIIKSWNKGAEKIFGYTAEKIIGRHISILIPASLQSEEDTIIAKIKSGEKIDHYQTIRLSEYGKEIPVSLTVSPIRDSFGNIIGASKIIRDNSDQLKIEKAIRQGEEKQAILSAIIESSDDAIISKTLEGIITSWNASAQKIFGYTESEIIGQHIGILIPLRLQNEENTIISNIKAGRRIDHFKTIRVHKSGREIPVSLTVSPVKDKEGHIIGASKTLSDISERLQAEQAIRQSAKKMEILNAIGKVISEKLDAQTILQHVTDATTELTGAGFGTFFYNMQDEQGESFTLYTLSGVSREDFARFDIPRNTAIFPPVFNGKEIVRVDDLRKDPRYGKNAQYLGMPKDHLSVVSYLAIPVISSSGSVIGGLFFGHPEPGIFTSEHEDLVVSIASQTAVALDNAKLFEEVKALSAKKDEFIALASHELKTPLTTIKGYLQILHRIEKEPDAMRFIEKTRNQVEKLNNLISDLLDVSKIEAGKLQFNLETFDLRQLLLDVIDTFLYTHQTHRISFNDQSGALHVKADKQRIEQAIINLLTNAIKYSPKADEINVGTETDGSALIVKIRDKGIGLSAAQQDKIFARFYRAEGISNISGLGLGLYLTKEIIDRHHGQIGVRSELGKGSEFWFSLPLKS